MRQLNFDEFCDKKTQGGRRVFALLLGDECPFLNSQEHWWHHLPFESYVVRLQEEDFNSLDIGRHPKIIYTQEGDELGATDGFPSPESFNSMLRKLTNEQKGPGYRR